MMDVHIPVPRKALDQAKALSCGKLDIANSGKLYHKIPLWIYANIHSLNLSETTISSDNFVTLMKAATYLKSLQIKSCGNITEDAIFRAKYSLPNLRSVNISFNP